MIAFRTTWYIKPGMMKKTLALLESEVNRLEVIMIAERYKMNGEARAYTPRHKPNTLILELDFDTESENEEFWALNNRQSEARQAFMEQWSAVTEEQGETEVWDLQTGYFQSVRV